jgi:type IV pilus assembly protein PilA
MTKLRQRLSITEGFTLIELLIVIVIIGILLAIAVPSYLGFKTRANNRAAQSDVREAIPVAEAYYSDNNSYALMTPTLLKGIDTGLSAHVSVAGTPTTGGYCLNATVGGQKWSAKGPGAVWHNTNDCSGATANVG